MDLVTDPKGNRSLASFGTITVTHDPRRIQLGVKLSFWGENVAPVSPSALCPGAPVRSRGRGRRAGGGGLGSWKRSASSTCKATGERAASPRRTRSSPSRALLTLGVTTLELDLAVTKDGVVVVSHDPLLNPD